MRPPPAAMQRLVASRAGSWFYTHVSMRIDRVLIPLTRGRLSMSLSMPNGMLVCRGARSGAERRVPLLYVPWGDRVVLIASNGGAPANPAWFHNLRAHPDVRFAVKGAELPYRARMVEGEERRELWDRAVRQYVGYSTYQDRTRREVPVFVLDPA